MKLLSTEQIQALDAHTIENEPIASLDLMERAASRCLEWLLDHVADSEFIVVCGTGNNGGDGLAIARMLSQAGSRIQVWIAGNPNTGSPDFQANYERLALLEEPANIIRLDDGRVPEFTGASVIIDALFGTGLTRQVEGWRSKLIQAVNASGLQIISIDIPSGLFADHDLDVTGDIIHADHTLTFQIPKMSMLFRESGRFAGKIHVLDIGLDSAFHASQESPYFWTTASDLKRILKPRKTFEHKGSRGHLLVVAGSRGKMGAAVLAARASLRTGCGLTTVHVPQSGLDIMQTAAPEVMCTVDQLSDHISHISPGEKVNALAAGPGMGTHPDSAKAIQNLLLKHSMPVVIDADGLNNLAASSFDLSKLAGRAILTPHPGEFDRLFGVHDSSAARFNTLRKKSVELGVVIVLKGAYTRVALPDGSVHFNSSGNPGMATAGSGDVLTGVIGSLLAQGYAPGDAARLGVFLHGVAGDEVLQLQWGDAMLAGDLIAMLPDAWAELLAD